MSDQTQQAVQAYIEARQQMKPREAAAHTAQRFGIAPGDLARAVADAGQLLVQQPSQGLQGLSTHRQAASA